MKYENWSFCRFFYHGFYRFSTVPAKIVFAMAKTQPWLSALNKSREPCSIEIRNFRTATARHFGGREGLGLRIGLGLGMDEPQCRIIILRNGRLPEWRIQTFTCCTASLFPNLMPPLKWFLSEVQTRVENAWCTARSELHSCIADVSEPPNPSRQFSLWWKAC